MLHFCTYFDINYIHRGLALYRSLELHAPAFTLWILCFDDRTYGVLESLNLPKARLIRRQDFEAGDSRLVGASHDRSIVEYYWTCTPSLPLYILRRQPDINAISYLDADLFFIPIRVLCSTHLVPEVYLLSRTITMKRYMETMRYPGVLMLGSWRLGEMREA